MTEDVESLVLEHLRSIRADIANLKDEMRSFRAEVAAVRHELRAVATLAEQCFEDIATIRVRLDRIERRLDIAELAK